MKAILLGDLAEKITKGTTPTSYGKSFTDEGVNYIKVESITDQGTFIKNKFAHVDEETHNKLLKRSILEKGDILLTMAGAIGRVAQIEDQSILPANTNQAVALIRINKPGYDTAFIKYFLSSPSAKSQILGGTVQTAQPNISLEQIGKIMIPDLDLATQKQIVDILEKFDQKIRLNALVNETLEEIGQALLKHYFIDNPESKKWQKRTLGEFFPVKTGKKDANFGTVDGDYPFFTCAQKISKAPDYSFDGSAILLAGNGDFNIKYYRGRFEAYQRTYVLMPKNEEMLGYLFFVMSLFLGKITGGSRGSVIKFITKGMIEDFKVCAPDDAQIEKLSEPLNRITINIAENKLEIDKLVELRDSLLPRLISGKIKV